MNHHSSRYAQWIPSLLVVCLALCCPVSMAQQKFVRAQGTDVSREAAAQKAKSAAWKQYLGTLQGAKLDNIIANEKHFLDDLHGIVVDVSVVDERCGSGPSASCTVSIKATINEAVVDSRLRQAVQASGGGKASVQDEIALLVMARVADSQTSFETKVTKRTESTMSLTGSSASADASVASRSGSSESSADAVSVTQSAKTVTGGSEENKRDKIKFVAWPNLDDLQNRIGEALNNSRIGTIPWEELVSNCGVTDNDPFSKMYAESETGQLPSTIRNDTFKKIKDCQLNKFILASIEVDGYRTDPSTGLWLATGNMNISVYDLSGRFARSIGSANRTFSGRAEKLNDAGRAALANAAKLAVDVVVNQLSLK
jgi:hypothetical protein